MRLRSLVILRCPISGQPLTLAAIEKERLPLADEHRAAARELGIDAASLETVVKTGVLHSPAAGVWYPVVDYVPVLLDFPTPLAESFKARYASSGGEAAAIMAEASLPTGSPRPGEEAIQRSFTAQWDVVQDEETFNFSYTLEQRRNYIALELDWPGDLLRSGPMSVLDVGCGCGNEAMLLQEVTGKEVLGMDLNLSLLRKGRKALDNPFLHLAVASLFAIPAEKARFDIVYCNGVLIHTYSTRKGFESILEFMKPDGFINIWVSSYEEWAVTARSRFDLTVDETIRPFLAARFPTWLQRPILAALAWRHYRRMRRLKRANPGHYLELDSWRYSNSLHSVRDQWTPVFAHKHLYTEVATWFGEKGLRYRFIDHHAYHRTFGAPHVGICIRGLGPGRAEEGRACA